MLKCAISFNAFGYSSVTDLEASTLLLVQVALTKAGASAVSSNDDMDLGLQPSGQVIEPFPDM